MKKTRKLLVAAAALITAAFVGCSMMDDTTVGSSSGRSLSGEMIGIISNLADYDTASASSNSRSILPASDTTVYDYYLMGMSSSKVEFPKVKLTVTGGTFTVPIATPAAYDFTLFAVKTGGTVSDVTLDNVTTKALLVGYAYADLTSSTAPVTFVLSPDKCTGAGFFDLDFYLSNTAAKEAGLWTFAETGVNKATAYIQNVITGETVKYYETTTPASSELAFGGASTASWATDETNKMAPGTYNLLVEFTQDSGLQFYWSDIFVIISGRTTEADVFIPNMIGAKPGNVTSLTACYLAGTDDKKTGYYKVHFKWDASNVNNEKYFLLELADVGGLTNDTTTQGTGNAKDWVAGITSTSKYSYSSPANDNNATADAANKYSFLACADRVDGSLIANNSHLTMWIPLGRAFDARIKAVNNIGVSDEWTYLKLTNGTTTPSDPVDPNKYDTDKITDYTAPTGESIAYFTTADVANSTINRYRITYDYNNALEQKKVVYDMVKTLAEDARVKKSLWAADLDGLKTSRNQTFKYWKTKATSNLEEDRVYTAGEGEITNTTYKIAAPTSTPTGATSEDFETSDNGGYYGIANQTFYADYVGDMKGSFVIEELEDGYTLTTNWLQYKTTKTTTPTAILNSTETSQSLKQTISKKTEGTAQACAITYALTVPELVKKYKSATATGYTLNKDGYFALISENGDIEISDLGTTNTSKLINQATYLGFPKADQDKFTQAYEKISTVGCKTKYDNVTIKVVSNQDGKSLVHESVAGAALNSANTFSGFDVKNWENGTYNVSITGTVTVNKKPITRKISIVLEITD